MSCAHLKSNTLAYWKCVLLAKETVEPLWATVESRAQQILLDITDEELSVHPQTILRILQALYYDDKKYGKVVQIGTQLKEMLTTETTEQQEILAECTLLYESALEKLSNAK